MRRQNILALLPFVLTFSLGLAHAEPLERASRTFQAAARTAMPSVVTIEAERSGQNGSSIGSGIILRSDGMILTNSHVIEQSRRIRVTLGDQRKFTAKLIGSDPQTDVAVVKIALEKPASTLVPVRFANSDAVEVGDWVITIGNPFGLARSVTAGIVSAKGRGRLGIHDIEDFIQTDAPINPGNSGGPLLNLKGEMIGLNAAIFSKTGGFMGISFSISSNLVKKVSDSILTNGKVRRGFLGLSAQDLDSDLAHYFAAPDTLGALVNRVNPQGPAARIPLEPGDVIVRWATRPVRDSLDLKTQVGGTEPGKKVQLEWLHRGERKTAWVDVAESPQNRQERAGQMAPEEASTPELNHSQAGLGVEDIPSELEALIGLKRGEGAWVVRVEGGSPASEAGILPGDVILALNQISVKSASHFKKLTREHPLETTWLITLQRGTEGNRAFVVISRQNPGQTEGP